VFGLQPHHFVTARRGVEDYLRDFDRSVVSYRELDCDADACTEVRREEPMTDRGRVEFAYHMMRFLMQNLLKLVRRTNEAPDGEPLLDEFLAVFPRGAADYRLLYLALQGAKKSRRFDEPLPNLAARLRAFLADFQAQFRDEFTDGAARHVVFRHAATRLNGGAGGGRTFQGRIDPPIEPTGHEYEPLVAALRETAPAAVYASPARRCRQSLELIGELVDLPPAVVDARLAEIDYGACDCLTIDEARRRYPALFAAWRRGDDPRFPGGENTADVLARAGAFADARWTADAGPTLTATHNVVLRTLVGDALGAPRRDWHRIAVPHLAPIAVVATRRFGRFVDLEPAVERRLFADFLHEGALPRRDAAGAKEAA
jgi:broad specificity phosphatase PhoE